MKEECRKGVEASLGRPITQGEARDLEGRVRRAMVQEARRDVPSWRALSSGERIQQGAKVAADEIVAEARKAAQRAALNIQKSAEVSRYLDEQVASGRDKTHLDALQRVLVAKYDERNNRQSLESLSNGLFNDAISRIAQAAEDVTPDFFGRAAQMITRDRSLQNEFVNALHGVEGARPEIKKAAESFHKITNELREHFNAIGGRIGRLDNWGQPHAWSRSLALKKGKAQFVGDFMKFVDREVYVREDGRPFTDEEMRAFLEEAWLTIATDGVGKAREPTPGGAMKANRHAKHRQIHLRPEAAVEALQAYSERNPLQAMFGHLRQISRDIALIETFGPNPDHIFESLLQQNVSDAARADPGKVEKADAKATYLASLFDNIAGNIDIPKSRTLADSMAAFRSLQTAAKLGSAVISSITDLATLHQTALHNGLSPLKVALNSAKIWSPKSRKYARRLGLMTDAIIGHSERYVMDNLTGKGIFSKTASFVLGASGLNFVTDARRLGFSLTMMDALGSMTRRAKTIEALAKQDKALLQRKGVTQADWDIWAQAKLDQHNGNGTLLTPESIMRVTGVQERAKRLAVAKLLGLLDEERDIAVISPGARERAQLALGTKPGTGAGELVRSIFLFKSFPWTVSQRYWERAKVYGGLRFPFLGAMFLTMSALGAVALWIEDLLNGRDPRSFAVWDDDETDQTIATRNVISASLKGGGLGVFGDFLFYESHSYSGNSLAEIASGPAVQTASQAFNLTQGNITQALAGEETNFGPEAVKFARGNLPAANLWYTKGIIDRFIFNARIEELEPGYFDRLQRRQRTNQGAEYWWQPDEQVPDRAPNVGAAIGQ